MNEQPRASFGGKLSVILVAAGSAIGLGALWRFPYIAGKHGGAAFLLVFLLSVLVVGIPVMLAEFAVGRHTKKNAVGAFRALSKRWSWLGYSGVLGALLISGYYYLIAGWSLEYFISSVTGDMFSSTLSYKEQFDLFQASWKPLLCGILFILMTHFIVSRGVEKGIEKASKIMMPALLIILIIMAVRVAFMPGASEGYSFFLSCAFCRGFQGRDNHDGYGSGILLTLGGNGMHGHLCFVFQAEQQHGLDIVQRIYPYAACVGTGGPCDIPRSVQCRSTANRRSVAGVRYSARDIQGNAIGGSVVGNLLPSRHSCVAHVDNLVP